MSDTINEAPPKQKRRRRTAARKRTTKNKKTPRRTGRFCLSILLGSLLCAAAVFVFLPQIWQSVGDLLPAADRQKPANQLHEIHEPDVAEQAARFRGIPSADVRRPYVS